MYILKYTCIPKPIRLGYILWCICLLLISCQDNRETLSESIESRGNDNSLAITLAQAEHLSSFAFHCVDTQYPNKLGQVLGDDSDLRAPTDLHPAFYGCFDWHSAVHGHWALVRLLKSFPDLSKADSIRQKIDNHITESAIAKELEYFQGEHNKSFERTYGWAWLLKLTEELYMWDDPQAKEWHEILKPLADLVVAKYHDFLPKLAYPIRVGEHSNTAFGLSFAHDYAIITGDDVFRELIENTSRAFYIEDRDCPISWEPSGFDFLSPCLQEAFLMQKILNKNEFGKWAESFLGDELLNINPAIVIDRTDGKLVHLDGLNFSRAWCLYGLSSALPKHKKSLKSLADNHLQESFDKMSTGDYAGEHWLASFALYALYQGSLVNSK